MVHGLLRIGSQVDPGEPQAPVAQGIEHPPSKRDVARSNRAGGAEPYHHRYLFSDQERAVLAPRFWAKVDRSGGEDACWPWIRARGRAGYGQWHPYAGIHTPSHRFALSLSLGRDLVPAEVAMHLCHNPPCCNPRHLKPGSYSDNGKHSANDGRAFVGELNVMARFSASDVADLRTRAATEFRRGWLTQEARRLKTKTTVVSRMVRGEYWGHLPGAVAIVTYRNKGLPMPVRGFCFAGHKKRENGYCECGAGRQARYRLRRVDPQALAVAIVAAAEARS